MAEASRKAPDEKFCSECGAVIKAKAEICPRCGVRQAAPAWAGVAPNGRSKLGAALFAILLGGIGAHKFYLGQTGMGIIYLLLCWTFVPAVLGVVEGIILLGMSQRDFDEKYGNP